MSNFSGDRETNGTLSEDKFRIPVPIPPANTDSTSVPNWLHQSTFLDGNSGGQHFSSWERTTHFRTQGSSSLITTVQQQTTVNGGVTKPVIKPIPSRLGSPLTMIKYEPKHYPELLTPTFMNSSIKFESSPVTKFDDDAVDSAFEDDSGCSRTTPVNHKSLRKWRQHSQPSGGKGRSSFQPISIHTSSPFEESVIGGPLSAPSILHHWTNNRPGSSGGGSAGSSSNGSFAFSPRDSLYASPTGLSFRDSFESSSRLHSKSETITSPEHLDVSDEGGHGNTVNQALSIPVGIAVARQRERESSPMVKSDIELMIPPAPGKLSLDSYSRPPPAHHQPQPIPSWPPLPFAADAFAHQSALAASLPLGYQLAKDPLTGQVFFVPGAAFATAFTHTQLLWPPPGASMPPPPPPPPLSTSPFHQSLLQLQQETWMARHQFLYGSSLSQLSAVAAAAANVPTPPPAHQRSSEPLTTLRVPTSAAVASLIAENGHIRRPPRTFKQETQDGDVKQNSNFLVGSFNNSSSLADSAIGINSINSECSDDRISVGSFSDEVKFTPPIVTVTTPEDDDIADHLTIENVKTERKDSFDQEQSDQNHNHDEPVKSGLDLLTEGIERLEKLSENGNDKRPRLSSTPPRGGRQMSVDVPRSSGGLRLLCDAALMSKDVDEDRSSPKVRSKSLDSHMQSTPKAKYDLIARNYSSPRAEQNAKAFIASKSVKVGDLLGVELGTGNNSDLGTWEKNVRLNIANIQRQYKEKYKELYKLQHQTTKKSSKGRRSSSESSPPKKMAKTDSHSPGRERESSLWVPKPKHTHIKTENNHHHKRQTENNTSDNVQWEIKRDLSDITSKFKSSRPNPFENLLRLATSKSSPKPEPIYSSTPKIHKPVTLVGNVTPICASPPSTENSTVDVTNNTEKSRHSSPPRKTFGISVSNSHNITIKAKEDRNAEEKGIINSNKLEEIEDLKSCQSKKLISSPVLEPMTELKGPSITFKISKKEPIQEEIEDDVLHIKTKKNKKYKKNKKDKKRDRKEKKERRMKVVVDDEESCDTILDREIKSQIHKKKKNKKSRETLGQDPSSCVIQESDLTEGLRVLIKLEGHFYPGKIQAISPPDIYGVLVDRERGNKPHIFSREEVLQDAVFEVRPASSEDLTPGTRVCAYWSQKYHHLYPGTVSDTVRSDPKLDSNFVNIELDDGDSRDIHIDNIRYLPPEYPLVEYDPDPMASLTKRKRRHSFESTTSEGSRATKTPRLSVDEQHGSCIVRFPAPPPGCQRSLWSSQDMSEPTSPPSKQLKLRVNITHAKREGSKDKGSGAEKSSGMAAFLHPQQLWRWSSSGDRRPRSRRITHQEIEREEDGVLSVGDCAVFLSTGRPDRPYVGKIEALWESAGGHMRVKVRWFYHAVETEGGANGGRRVDELNLPGALFQSNHFDENDVQTISHRCEVLSYKAYKRIMDADPQRLETVYENNDLYYLAGEYDPIVGIIQFEKGVLESK